jgi:hypothetical protein
MKDLFGYEKPKVVYEDTLVCIKCNTRQPIDQFNAMKYANSQTDKKTEIKRTCRTCIRNQSSLVKDLKRKHPYPNKDYKCPICERGIDEIGKYGQPRLQNWVLDHHCNVGLGGFKDSLTRLKKAVIYLTKHENKKR